MRARKNPVDSRPYNGIRRIDVSLPVEMVVALDRNIDEFGYFVIRQFLERGGINGSRTKTTDA